MSELDNFINNLSDHELAVFYRYSYDGFLENSKRKIDEEIKKRNISIEKLNSIKDRSLINNSSGQSKICTRSGSDKLFVETNYKEIPVSDLSSAEIAIDSYRCRLCGYNPDKTKSKNLLDILKRTFRKGRNLRINKWNEWCI